MSAFHSPRQEGLFPVLTHSPSFSTGTCPMFIFFLYWYGITMATIWNKSIQPLLSGWHSLVQGSDFKGKQRTEAPDRWRRQNFLLTKQHQWKEVEDDIILTDPERGRGGGAGVGSEKERDSNNPLVRKLLSIPEVMWERFKQGKRAHGFFIWNDAISS